MNFTNLKTIHCGIVLICALSILSCTDSPVSNPSISSSIALSSSISSVTDSILSSSSADLSSSSLSDELFLTQLSLSHRTMVLTTTRSGGTYITTDQALSPTFSPSVLDYSLTYSGGNYYDSIQANQTDASITTSWDGGYDFNNSMIVYYTDTATFHLVVKLSSPTHPDTVRYTITFLPGTAP